MFPSCLLSLFLSVDWSQKPCSPLPPWQRDSKSEQSKAPKEISHSNRNSLKVSTFFSRIQIFQLIEKDILGIYQYFLLYLKTKTINSVLGVREGETHIKYERTDYLINALNSEEKIFLYCNSRFSTQNYHFMCARVPFKDHILPALKSSLPFAVTKLKMWEINVFLKKSYLTLNITFPFPSSVSAYSNFPRCSR